MALTVLTTVSTFLFRLPASISKPYVQAYWGLFGTFNGRNSVKMKKIERSKEGCVFPLVAVSILPHAEFGPSGHRGDTATLGYKAKSKGSFLSLKHLISLVLILSKDFLLYRVEMKPSLIGTWSFLNQT